MSREFLRSQILFLFFACFAMTAFLAYVDCGAAGTFAPLINVSLLCFDTLSYG